MSSLVFAAVLSALPIGISAGISPGPLSTYITRLILIGEIRRGVIAAFAPLLTDGPICIVFVLLVTKMDIPQVGLGILSFVGAIFLIHLAWKDFKSVSEPKTIEASRPSSTFWKAVVLNMLNPSPYIFWSTVGTPLIASFQPHVAIAGVSFFLAFLLSMAVSKIALGLTLKTFFGGAREITKITGYVAAALMSTFAVMLFWQTSIYWGLL